MLFSGIRYRRREATMTLAVDLFFSFRSPYSYLALPRTMKLAADYDVTVSLRPVYPLAVPVPGFFKRTNPQIPELRHARRSARCRTREDSVSHAPPRPHRPGPRDAGSRRAPALHPPADAPR